MSTLFADYSSIRYNFGNRVSEIDHGPIIFAKDYSFVVCFLLIEI